MARRSMETLIAKGENPNGFTSETPNGRAHATGTGWNKIPPRPWHSSLTMNPEPELMQNPAEGAWCGDQTNRTGE